MVKEYQSVKSNCALPSNGLSGLFMADAAGVPVQA